MPSAADISSWPTEQVRQEINKLLPPDWSFTEAISNGWASGTISDKEGAVQWDETEPDRRLLLLSAYGWLWLRGQTPKHPAWKLRKPGGALVTPKQAPEVPDPPDLDPSEINKLVYERKPTKR